MGLSDQAIGKIRDLILSGELGPGDRIPPEQVLARQLGVSRNSMREAVKALAHAQVLDVRQGDGTYVTSLEPRLLLDGLGFAVELMGDATLLQVMEVRRMLEPVATAAAATRIDETELLVLRQHVHCMEQAQDDAEQLVAHDAAFHDCLVRATGNQTLVTLLNGLSTSTMRARTWRAAVEAGAATTTVAQHEEIYAAVAAHDPKLAEAVALVHITTSEAWLRAQLEPADLVEGSPVPHPALGSSKGRCLRQVQGA